MTQRMIDTKAYGSLPVEERQIITFPRGLFGFDEVHEYALLDSHTPPFYWLQSTTDRNLAFILVNPYIVVPEYLLDIPEEDLESIGTPEPDDLLVFAIVTIPQDRRDISCNLQGPLIVNRDRRLGHQSISLDPQWKIKHYLVPREGRDEC
ncbi:MAG: flagellar assembly protein FliW [Alkalispirochaeta sp.]